MEDTDIIYNELEDYKMKLNERNDDKERIIELEKRNQELEKENVGLRQRQPRQDAEDVSDQTTSTDPMFAKL